MKHWLQKHPKTSLLIINFILIGFLVISAEIILHQHFPYYTSIKPLIQPENYYKYGWGNFPKEKIFVFNVDTGEKEWQRVNNHGWRDRNRRFKKDKNTFRILMLGDSEMYGSLVSNDERYPILFEDLLKNDFNIEVVSLSFYGWGTDQMLEALKLDGVKYNPDYVMLQFNQNDVYDNIAFQLIEELVGVDSVKLDFKPFYHTLDENGEIVRHKNPYFDTTVKREKTNVRFKRAILQHSEIAKRIYGLILNKSNRLYNEIGRSYFNPDNIPLIANDLRLLHLKTVLELPDTTALIEALEPLNTNFYQPTLDSILSATTTYAADTQHIIKTILEDLYFQQFWLPDIYRPTPPDSNSRQWKMYYKMLEKVKSVTDSLNVPLAVFPVVEQGSVNFAIERYWMYPDSVYIQNALLPNKMVEEFCSENDIEFININTPLQRARNDIHMNEKGNQTLAKELYNYIIANKKEMLQPYLKKN